MDERMQPHSNDRRRRREWEGSRRRAEKRWKKIESGVSEGSYESFHRIRVRVRMSEGRESCIYNMRFISFARNSFSFLCVEGSDLFLRRISFSVFWNTSCVICIISGTTIFFFWFGTFVILWLESSLCSYVLFALKEKHCQIVPR